MSATSGWSWPTTRILISRLRLKFSMALSYLACFWYTAPMLQTILSSKLGIEFNREKKNFVLVVGGGQVQVHGAMGLEVDCKRLVVHFKCLRKLPLAVEDISHAAQNTPH